MSSSHVDSNAEAPKWRTTVGRAMDRTLVLATTTRMLRVTRARIRVAADRGSSVSSPGAAVPVVAPFSVSVIATGPRRRRGRRRWSTPLPGDQDGHRGVELLGVLGPHQVPAPVEMQHAAVGTR
ncbi:hypothetical protein AQI96_32505 [Streptomyces canus]|nr:hypothetical protein AQI96_32505 [Streptomyces canus]